ncbi:MAG: cyclic peptide export ABC transporter [Acidobacteriota bacterium]|nr:cyclic peptide export ABC transporter [Acidobacteriota bacterium]
MPTGSLVDSFPIVRLLRRGSSKFGGELVAIVVVSGLTNALLLAIINAAAQNASNEAANTRLFWLFAIVITAFVVTQRHILFTSTVEVERLLHQVRVRLSRLVGASDLLPLERIGRSEIYASVNRETVAISQAAATIIIACQSAAMVLFSTVYLAWLSRTAFVLTALLTWVALRIHFRRSAEYNRQLQEATQREDDFFDALTHLLDGFKEVKMSRERSEDLSERLVDISGTVSDLKTRAGTSFAAHYVFATVAFYMLIAAIVFVLPRISLTYSSVIIKLTAAVLFIIGPLSGLVGSIPIFARANVAATNIETLEHELVEAGPAEGEAAAVPPVSGFGVLQLEDVTFRYRDKAGAPQFGIGPATLTIPAGELLFVVGGNGSGKSTFLKVLTGLYTPLAGRIAVDRTPVTPADAAWYRSHFSVIFSDYHLFDRLYGLRGVDPDRVQALLAQMQLAEKTRFENGRFSTIELSNGQKKRLALVVCMLEDRPIMVFDEVAADQDPSFRQYFYEELLPSFKRQGKTVIAVTHDDRYFGVADRVLKMDYGQFVPLTDVQGQ